MAFSAGAMKPPLHDQMAELQRKIQLLEGEKAAYYESSQSTLKKNTQHIRQLRQENKKLRREVVEANTTAENIVKVAFHDRGTEKDAYRNMSGTAAVAALEQRVLSKMKTLNALKHTNQKFQHRLEELKLEHQRLKPEGSSGAQSADAFSRKMEEDAMKLRALENNLEKIQFKCKEAENIMVTYQKIKSHMQEESLTFQGHLDSLEADILKHREALSNMHVMNNKAQLSKEAAKLGLQGQEESLYKERKERERIIASYRKKVEERKTQAEKAERRAQRTTMQPDELSSEAQRSSPRLTGEEEKAISTFEEAFQCIKEAMGVTDVQEIAERFITQKETYQHLVELERENKKSLQQLKEQNELLIQQLQDMKYSGEAKLSSDQQMLEECKQQLQAQQQKCDKLKELLEGHGKTLCTVRAGVEHLADKLQHITLSEDTVSEVSPDSEEFVLELMTQCELKLKILHDELQGKDVAAIMKEIEEEEFFVKIEGKLPVYNMRVKLPEYQRLDHSGDEDDSAEDEADIITREALKHQSQLIIDSMSKKKPGTKKRGKF